MPITFRMAPGLAVDRRGIGFLEDDQNDDLNAGEVFDDLGGNTEQKVRSRMDYWVQGGVHDKWFHGWPNLPEYKQCFEFKWDERRRPNRFYGFLCHPNTDPRFQLCVLVFHIIKDDDGTDFSMLDVVNRLPEDSRTVEAIAQAYPEFRNRGKKTWLQ